MPTAPLDALTARRCLPRLGLLALAALLLLGPVAAADESRNTASPVAETTTPRVSPHDDRAYRALTLENGLEVLLISDPDADKAAASMNVGAGSAQNPEDLAGLAHFLEHMLFLGTDAFPEPDAYQGYISRHGGSHNAFTASRDTNYFFDIDPDFLPGALHRFSRFFVAPRFNADKLESERNVVHAEYMARFRDEGRRENDVLNQLLNPANPTTRFSVGSRETLEMSPDSETSLRDRVIAFYERHYGANVMHLTVIAPQPLDTLEAMVTKRFAAIPDRGLSRPVIAAPLVEASTLPQRVAMRSLSESHQLRFLFPVPDPDQHYRLKPASYLGNLLGHEGEGSLLDVLRNAGLADGLSAGAGHGDGRHALFTVDISLTPEGAERIDQVEATLFAAIEAIRTSGLDDWRYDEQAQLLAQEFRFRQEGSPLGNAMRLAMNMAHYPLEDAVYAPYRMDGFDRDLVARYLDALTPDNLIRLYSGPAVEGEQVTAWFEVPWRATGPREDASPLAGLALPEPNPYIAGDLELLEVQDQAPSRLVDDEGFVLWHMADSRFDTPKVEWRFSLQPPSASATAREAALTRLLAGWLDDSLNATLYPARLAGQDFKAYAHARGITLSFSGWRDGQDRLLRRVLEQLREGEIAAASFERVQHRHQRQWRNAPQAPLSRQAWQTLSVALLQPQWPTEALLAASRELTLEDLRAFRRAFLDDLRLEAMAVGNLTADQALREGELVAEALDPRLADATIPELVPRQAEASLPPLVPDSSRQESVVLRYLQGADRSIDSQAHLAVLGKLIDTPFYQRLRTEQQLGYVVNAGYSPMLDAPGISLLVQSPQTPSGTIQTEIDAFLATFGEHLASLDETQLAPYRQAVHDSLTQRDTSLGGKADRLWQATALDDLDFDRRERVAERALTVSAEALRALWSGLQEGQVVNVTYDPGDAPSDVIELTRHLVPLPDPGA